MNFYCTFNSHLTVAKSRKKYYSTDGIYLFFAFWSDWFSYFWVYAFGLNKVYKKKIVTEENVNNNEEGIDQNEK